MIRELRDNPCVIMSHKFANRKQMSKLNETFYGLIDIISVKFYEFLSLIFSLGLFQMSNYVNYCGNVLELVFADAVRNR